MSAPHCSVCYHDRAIAITDLMRAGGMSVRTLAKDFGLSKSAIARHAKHLERRIVPPVPPAVSTASQDDPNVPVKEPGNGRRFHAPGPPLSPSSLPALPEIHDDKLTVRQRVALDLLMRGSTHQAAAAAAEVSVRTLWEWRHRNAEFIGEYERQTISLRQSFEGKATLLGHNAVGAVDDLMRSPQQPGADIRLRAATAGLQAATRLASRFKSLEIQGFISPAVPLVVFPEGTRMPWANKQLLPVMPFLQGDSETLDAETTDDNEDEV